MFYSPASPAFQIAEIAGNNGNVAFRTTSPFLAGTVALPAEPIFVLAGQDFRRENGGVWQPQRRRPTKIPGGTAKYAKYANGKRLG